MNTAAAYPAKQDKLYVLAQIVGWVGFTLICIGLSQLHRGFSMAAVCICTGSNAIGWLLSHLYRGWIHRRGWKHLNWPALLPRVAIAVVVLSVLWAVLDRPLYYATNINLAEGKVSETAHFIYSVFNGVWILMLWSLLYFGYNIADRFRRSEVERVHLQATLKEAELRALKSQVNPHFIFNALPNLFLCCINTCDVSSFIIAEVIGIVIRIAVFNRLKLLFDGCIKLVQPCRPKLVEEGYQLQPVHQDMVLGVQAGCYYRFGSHISLQ